MRETESRPVTAEEAEVCAEEERLAALARSALPNARVPYIGHIKVQTGGRRRDVLLSDHAFIDADRGLTIVDWRRAPIAEVFFGCEPGDDYEIEIGGRSVEGILERRHVVILDRGEPSAISTERGTLRRIGAQWRFDPEGVAPTIDGAPRSLDGFKGDESTPIAPGRAAKLSGLLDAHQTALLERDAGEPLLVLGSAGCGKTTVALHRVAALCKKYPETFAEESALVIVPEPGLRHFAERLLEDLGVERAVVRTFDEWIRGEARRVFPWLPDREAPDPPFAVSRMKRHPAIFEAMDRLLEDLMRDIAERLDGRLAGRGRIAAAITKRRDPILMDRLRHAERELTRSAKPEMKRAIAEDFREERRKLVKVKEDLARLVGDRELLGIAARASMGDLTKAHIDELAEHTNRQLEEPSEVRFAHVDADRLVTLDGRSLDEGTPEEVAGTVDVEDYALLFELLYRKTGKTGARSGKLATHAHLVVDEAQELAPIELRVLGRALDPNGGSLTVAGDAAQRIDKTSHFGSWDAAMAELGAKVAPAYLETSYRCSRPIMEFAHAVLGPDAPETPPRAARDGAPVLFTSLPTEGHAAAAIAHALRDLRDREPETGACVIASDAKAARALHAVLARALDIRLVLDGNFSFGPGVEVTDVANTKGLEFDYVIIPDADAHAYSDLPEQRRRLHVAATRAAHRLWIVSPGAPSPILPASLF